MDNILLEFTATCDLVNPAIRAAYENKIIFDYALAKFYNDRYSKDIITLRSDLTVMERALQALVLSQYRLKVFQDHRIGIKPVVLFKAAKIADSKDFMAEFIETVKKLTGAQLRSLSTAVNNEVMHKAFAYFTNNGISFDTLAAELRDDFSEEHCVSVNDDKDVFRNKTVNYTDPHDGGIGVSQNDPSVKRDWKIDLTTEDWFVYTDNYGTSEEKAFVAYFRGYVDDLRKTYSRIYLVRNEREFHIYSFEDGERFEPDYVLFLQRDKTDGFEQLQIFIEPKGTQLLEKDAWKEKFLLQLKTEAIPATIFVDDNDYRIWGLHFFNLENRMKEFDSEFEALIGK